LKYLEKLFISKKCFLYVFGNPYALQVIPNLSSTAGIVQVYQDFKEFQEMAAHQLLENMECKGALPVHITTI
jgi:beta-N-acetylhexosaminidase